MSLATFRVEPLDASFGALIHDLRLRDLDDAGFAALHATWLEYALLVFPGQHLTRDEQVQFARRFGRLEFDIAPISNVRADGSLRTEADADDDVVKVLVGNMGWHMDSTYMPVQARGAVFSAEIVPASRGNTEWADMRAAYDALPRALRERVDNLAAHHSLYYSQAKVGHKPKEGSQYSGYGFHAGPVPLRPLVKAHPDTGRKALVIGRHAHAIPGLDAAESERLLTELVEFACQPPRVVSHRWTPGDAVVWDNRCLLHRAMPWDMREPRVMWHSRIAGDPHSEASIETAAEA